MRLFIFILFMAASALADPGTNGLNTREMAEARKIYVTKCAKCHRFYEPKRYSDNEWQTWMQKMNQKSKLRDPQADLLSKYLNSYRAGQIPGKPQDKPRDSAKP